MAIAFARFFGGNRPMPVFVPQELLELRLKCPAVTCAAEFPIPFKDRQRQPIEPVFPRDYHHETNAKYWVCQSTQVKCPKCGAMVTLALPQRRASATITLFVDEAQRAVCERELWLFAAAGSDARAMPALVERVRRLKQSILSDVDPDTWQLHMTELWHGDERRKHPQFSGLTLPAVRRLVADVTTFIRDDQDIFKIASFSLREKSALGTAKRTAFQSLLIQTVECLTERGSAPDLRLDAERPESLRSQLTSWSEEVIAEQKHLLLFPFLTRGIPVPKPTFVKPAGTSCVELADFIAFWTARTIGRRLAGLPLDFELGDLGTVWYFAERSDGNLMHYRNQGLPWEAFFADEVPARPPTDEN